MFTYLVVALFTPPYLPAWSQWRCLPRHAYALIQWRCLPRHTYALIQWRCLPRYTCLLEADGVVYLAIPGFFKPVTVVTFTSPYLAS